jgi:hypothetical protein
VQKPTLPLRAPRSGIEYCRSGPGHDFGAGIPDLSQDEEIPADESREHRHFSHALMFVLYGMGFHNAVRTVQIQETASVSEA